MYSLMRTSIKRNKGFVKFVKDIEKKNYELRQIDSEGHAKYGYATSYMKRDIL